MKLSHEEINRKLLHVIALIIPIGIYYIPLLTGAPLWLSPVVLGILLIVSILIEVIRFRFPGFQKRFVSTFKSLLRKNEEQQVTGSVYLIGGAFICSFLFWKSPEISFMVLTLFILGDASASLIGMRFGRIRLYNKTVEGSLGCLILCLFLSLGVFPALPSFSPYYHTEFSTLLLILTCLCICLLELIPIKIADNMTLNDNLYVPPIAGLIMAFFQKII